MKLDTTVVMKQVDTKIENLHTLKKYLEEGNVLSIIEMFHQSRENKMKFYQYIEDNRSLMEQIAKYFNEKFKDFNYEFSMDRMVRNSDSFRIIHKKTLATVGTLSLYTKHVHIFSSSFKSYMQIQQDIEFLQTHIPNKQEKLEKFEQEWSNYKKFPKFIKKLMKMKSDEVVDNNLKNLNIEIRKFEKELQEKEDKMAFEWEDTVERHFQLKFFLQELENLGFKHDYYNMDESKIYFIYGRESNNHHYSGNSSYEYKNISILLDKEWEMAEVTSDRVYSRKNYTEEEFVHILQALQGIKEFRDVERKFEAECDVLWIDLPLGTISICKDGFINIYGNDLNIFHLLRYNEVRSALHLLYKNKDE